MTAHQAITPARYLPGMHRLAYCFLLLLLLLCTPTLHANGVTIESISGGTNGLFSWHANAKMLPQ